MYVCICHAVTEKDIQRAAEDGVCSMEMLSKYIEVSAQCGTCADYASEVLQKAIKVQDKSNCRQLKKLDGIQCSQKKPASKSCIAS